MLLKDVTLREAAQMPGRSYSATQRISAGTALDTLGVAYIQAGFPVRGEPDTTVVSELAAAVDATVTALARPLEGDIDAVTATGVEVVDLFIPLSEKQLEHSLGKSRTEAMDIMAEGIECAEERGMIPHLSIVDAFRTDLDHLIAFFERFSDAPYVTLADTVGCQTPSEVSTFLSGLAAAGIDLDRIGVHFHEDIGVGTANVLAAADAGVGLADVSVGALGERAGNPALEEVVVSGVLSREDSFGVEAAELIPASNDALDALDESIDARKPILGREVTTHESGIHTEAMLEDPSTFEPFDPSTFGGERTLLFGHGTGRTGAVKLLEQAGVDGDPDVFRDILAESGPVPLEEALSLATETFERQ